MPPGESQGKLYIGACHSALRNISALATTEVDVRCLVHWRSEETLTNPTSRPIRASHTERQQYRIPQLSLNKWSRIASRAHYQRSSVALHPSEPFEEALDIKFPNRVRWWGCPPRILARGSPEVFGGDNAPVLDLYGKRETMEGRGREERGETDDKARGEQYHRDVEECGREV